MRRNFIDEEEPDDNYIDECMKIFKRFLKDRGRFYSMMKFLFGYGRNKKQFYDDVRKLYKNGYDFRDILHITYTLGPADKKLGMNFWHKNIKPLSDEFKSYFCCNMHKIK